MYVIECVLSLKQLCLTKWLVNWRYYNIEVIYWTWTRCACAVNFFLTSLRYVTKVDPKLLQRAETRLKSCIAVQQTDSTDDSVLLWKRMSLKSGFFPKRGWPVVPCIWMVFRNQVHVLRWSIPVMAKALFPRAWVKKSFYFQVTRRFDNCSAVRIKSFPIGFRVIGCVEVPVWQLTVNMFTLGLPSCLLRFDRRVSVNPAEQGYRYSQCIEHMRKN